MATVVNKSNPGTLDRKYGSINRKVTGDPGGAVTPLYAGERVLSDNEQVYVARDTTNTGWQQLAQGY